MSNLKLKAEPTTHAEVAAFLDGKSRRALGYKTFAQHNADGMAVYHHDTAIVTYHADGSLTLDNGGWASPTTVNRMHKLTPPGVRVNLSRGTIYVNGRELGHNRPMTIDAATLAKWNKVEAARRAASDAEFAATPLGIAMAANR